VTLQGALATPVGVGIVAVALARVVGKTCRWLCVKARATFRIRPGTIEARRQHFFCLDEMLADVMPWIFGYLVKQHTIRMHTLIVWPARRYASTA